MCYRKGMAAKKKARGRPPLKKGQDRGSVITLRLKPSERKALEKAAKKADKSLSAWARDVLLPQAEIC